MRVTKIAIGAMLSLGAVVAGAGPAGAAPESQDRDITIAACIPGYVRDFYKVRGQVRAPEAPGYYQTTSGCSDINISPDKGVYVKVCFVRGSCQPSRKYAAAGRWTAIATGVRDNTGFYFSFSDSSAFGGQWAA